MGKIHSLETFGAVDGPGIRFVIFLQGCPMRCQYCHNPDSWEISGGIEMSAQELMDNILKYRNYYKDGGGVTVSGGEPMLQIDFVIDLFMKLKEEGIHTCLDTSGVTFSKQKQVFNKIEKLISLTDLVLLDIKHIDNAEHQKLTTKPNDNILDFARYLKDKKVPLWIRHVLVPGITTDPKSLENLRAFIDTLDNVEKVEVLPYHTMGASKYEKMGIDYKLKSTPPPTQEQIALANKILKG